MRKITFLMMLLIGTLAFSQELLTNGDFEDGATGWSGNALNVVTENENSYSSATVNSAGEPWSVQLIQVLSLTQGTTYTLTFDAWSDGTRTIEPGLGLNEPNWDTTKPEPVTLNNTSQTFTMDITSPITSDNARLLFDLGADTGFVGIDNVSLVEKSTNNGSEGTPPSTAAPTPTAEASNVVSIFSDVYTDTPVAAWGPFWGDFSSRINDVEIAGNATKVVNIASGQEFGGIDFAANKFDATNFESFHIDYYIPGPLLPGQVLTIKLSNHDGAEETNAILTTVTNLEVDKWVSLDLPLNDMVAGADPNAPNALSRNNIAQIIISAARADMSQPLDVYIDNIYFFSAQALNNKSFDINKIGLYPNPANNAWNITAKSNISEITVFNILGKQVLQIQPNDINARIDATGLNSGMYLAKIKSENSEQTIKLIKQ